MAVERPAGFDTHHHRAIVLLAGNPDGMRVSNVTTSEVLAAPLVAYLHHFGLVQLAGAVGERTAHITPNGRELIRRLHEEHELLA